MQRKLLILQKTLRKLMTTPPNIDKHKTRDHRLDIIKALSILLVLFWHFQPIDITAPELRIFHIRAIIREGVKVFYSQVTLLGVPSFILVSLYLYFQNLKIKGYAYAFSRLQHLLKLFTFWVFIQIVIYFFTTYPLSTPISQWIPLLVKDLTVHKIFIEGGPRLDFMGGSSVFYYFTSLFLLTIAATAYSLLDKFTFIETASRILIVGGTLIYFEYCSLKNISVELLNPITFLPYVPLAYYFARKQVSFSRSMALLFILGYIGFSIQDYYLRKQGYITNVYLRASIVSGALTLFNTIKSLPFLKESKAAAFLSNHSLGIYATHKYFQFLSIDLLTPLFAVYEIGKKTEFGNIHVNLQTLSIALLGISLTFLCVLLLGKTPVRGFFRG